MTTATKKCPHCGRWTEWQQQPTDQCQHCGQALEPYRVASDEARQRLSEQPVSSLMLIEIKPEDGALVRGLKYLIRGGQLAFAALMAFMIWLVTALAG
ncbi:hypothetical protein MUN84_01890 [Hymenobacter sp. 5516J-16]|uniref:Uncharacterized protein n=1 Tax=Hymenobacter sublimis TaxID=2933777 RepID=A0ABY4JGN3_9BACT|nr:MULTISPECIES: hypothetical protein [Hymenobacter]UOQ77484.1 hypothetical protein MUN84_01890 [Hymenobacter sp. 5516J-16]UPL51154.1 hypothetical protein MWH26_09660 [Hymenobacter sublimis]